MKRLLPLFLLLTLCFSSCTKEGLGDKYKGTYAGTYTFLNDGNKTKDGEVPVTKDPTEKDNVMIYYVLSLNHVSGGEFDASDIQNSEMMTKIVNAIFGNSAETAGQKIKNMNIKAKFDGDRLNMDITYEVEIGEITLEPTVITFTGTKK